MKFKEKIKRIRLRIRFNFFGLEAESEFFPKETKKTINKLPDTDRERSFNKQTEEQEIKNKSITSSVQCNSPNVRSKEEVDADDCIFKNLPDCYKCFDMPFINEWIRNQWYHIDKEKLDNIKYLLEIYEHIFKYMSVCDQEKEVLYINNLEVSKTEKFSYIIKQSEQYSQTYGFIERFGKGNAFNYAKFMDCCYGDLLQKFNKQNTEIEGLKLQNSWLIGEIDNKNKEIEYLRSCLGNR